VLFEHFAVDGCQSYLIDTHTHADHFPATQQQSMQSVEQAVVQRFFGRISTLATATLRTMGYLRAVALDGGMRAWRDAGYPVKAGPEA
jgi:rhodanese-related sulfurtransferase